MISVRVHGVTADPATNQFLMLLVDDEGGRLLPIVIGQWEAQSIAWNMQGITMQRPLTHDLFKNFLNTINVKITKIIIDDLKENTFYAKIRIKNKDIKTEIDSRPSDAVAIALRMDAPIFVEESVINKAAVKIDPVNQKDLNEISLLNKRLQKAIEMENYEEAAELRDKIKELEKQSIEEEKKSDDFKELGKQDDVE